MARAPRRQGKQPPPVDDGAASSGRISKIAPPTLHRVVLNARLSARLDAAFAHRVVWVHGPPGAGKTTLVASHLAARHREPLWYRLDEGDADPATVFFYLATGARHGGDRREALPLLTPELRGALPLFTRRFVRELFASRPACLVFDDYQEVAETAPLHEALAHGLEEVPEGSQVVIVSRRPPPPQLARLRLNGIVEVIEPDVLRMTAAEALALARARDPRADAEHVARIAALTQGWAAGVILMLEAGVAEAAASPTAPVPELLFDYFAGEVLARMPTEARRLLAMLATMPTVTAAQALRLTGSSAAPALLEDLRTRNYFTVRDGGAPPHYRFHPLFRAFLLQQAAASVAAEELVALRVAAADILDENGQSDAAAGLLAEAKAFASLGDLVRRRASTLLDEGRYRTLMKWLASLPQALIADDAWLSYFAGETRFWNSQPEDAISFFDRSFALFAAADDAAGQFLAWAGQADAVRLSPVGGQTRLDPLIRIFHNLEQRYRERPTGRTLERVAFVMALGLSRRGIAREETLAWQRLALSTAQEAGRPGGPELCHAMFAISDLQDSNFAQALRHLEQIPGPLAIAHLPIAEVPTMIAHAMAMMYRQMQGDLTRFTEAAIAQAESTGRTLWTHLLAGICVNDAYSRGDVDASGAWLARMAGCSGQLASGRGPQYHLAAAQHHLMAGNLTVSRAHADEAVTIAEASGWSFFEAITRAGRCDVLLETRALDEAEAELDRLDDLLARSATRMVALSAGLIRAELLFSRGDEVAGFKALAAAMALGREQGNYRTSFVATRAARLYARALRAGIEPDYVRELIRRVGVVAPDPHDETWPWPIRIVTLGDFEITVDGKPLAFSRKTPKRLIALVKAIATFGGRAVPEQKLIDALWPDDDGDAARNALTIAIHRLRKLLGDVEAVVVAGGSVGFDPKRCWLDLWTFEHLLPLGPDNTGAAIPRCERLFALYRGDFLAGDEDLPWAVPRREQLRARFARMVETRAAMRNDAIVVLRRGIEAAPQAEALYQGLMRHHLVNGRASEGLAVYVRLRKMLEDGEGVLPAPATEALHERLRTTSP